tara:strand:- start:9378 stop:10340 length:963 start_codon:yes stop_codon:yes gene_type:complete
MRNQFDKKRVLVTGGAGFLGSHLCKALIDDDSYVICLDDFSTGSTTNIANINHLQQFEFVEHDVAEAINLNVDEIYNLACPASPVHYQSDPIKTLKTCVIGALNVLDLAQKNSATVLQASTSEVYGDPTMHPQVEQYYGNVNPTGIRACYDEGKRSAETLFFDYQREKNVDIRVARIFNTYGPNMNANDGRVVSNFVVQAINNENITIYGDGQQTRSFCYVDDLIEALMKLMRSRYNKSPVNLGNPNEFTMLELADLVVALTKTESEIEHCDIPQDDPVRRKPDISLASFELDWKPKIELREGLSKTINYFCKNIEFITV